MIYTQEVQNMCPVAKGAKHEPGRKKKKLARIC